MLPPAEKINCARALELMEERLDDELDGSQIAALDSHTAQCPACAEEMALAAHVKSGLQGMPRFETPEHVLLAVRRATTEAPEAPFALRRSWRAVLGIAAALLLGAVVVPLLKPAPAPTPSNAELERAVNEARYAFALVGKTSRNTSLRLRNEALTAHLATPTVNNLVGPLRKGLARMPRTFSIQSSPTVTSQRSPS